MPGRQAPIRTEAQRILHSVDEERSAAWIGRRLNVTKQQAARWLAGTEQCPRRRQAQIAYHLETTAQLFDADGMAVPKC
jgi:hypothetical protein